MKWKKMIVELILALIACTAITAVSASAQSIDGSTITKLFKLDQYMLSHPQQFSEIAMATKNDSATDIHQIITDPEVADTYIEISYLASTPTAIIKTALVTVNPQNTARGVVPKVTIGNPSLDHHESTTILSKNGLNPKNYLLVTDPSLYGRSMKLALNPLFLYKNDKNELVLITYFQNNSDTNIEVNGLSHVELFSNGKVVASGNPSMFEKPMRFSTNPEGINQGVYDGLPNMCFIKITFEPGTYDDTVNIHDIGSLDLRYSLDYSTIQ